MQLFGQTRDQINRRHDELKAKLDNTDWSEMRPWVVAAMLNDLRNCAIQNLDCLESNIQQCQNANASLISLPLSQSIFRAIT
jgi:hypothetical protein